MRTRRSPRPLTPQPGAHPGADLDSLRGDDARDPTDRRAVPPRRSPRRRPSGRVTLSVAAVAAVATVAAFAPATGPSAVAADHDSDHDSDHDGVHTTAREHVTLDARNDGLAGPSEVPGGLVDITVNTEDNDVGHSVYVARIADGSTLEDVMAGGAEALATLLTFVGGAGTVQDGASVDLTLDLEPGNYVAIDNAFLPEPTGVLPFAVGEPKTDGTNEPEAEGTVQIGPGMLIAPPAGFDGGGTWRFENADDTLTHEALVVRLSDGVGVPDVVAWAHEGRPEPAPFEAELAGAGPIGPGGQAWVTLPELEPGDYALLCYVPFEDGLSHLSSGMIAPFTVA